MTQNSFVFGRPSTFFFSFSLPVSRIVLVSPPLSPLLLHDLLLQRSLVVPASRVLPFEGLGKVIDLLTLDHAGDLLVKALALRE